MSTMILHFMSNYLMTTMVNKSSSTTTTDVLYTL